jgi:hypothetical protein
MCTAAVVPDVLTHVSCTVLAAELELLMQAQPSPATGIDIVITKVILPQWVAGTALERFAVEFLHSPEFQDALRCDEVTQLHPPVWTDPRHHPQATPHLPTATSGCTLPLFLWQRRAGRPAPGATGAVPRPKPPTGINTEGPGRGLAPA